MIDAETDCTLLARDDLRRVISAAIEEVAASCGLEIVGPLTDDTVLLESGLDSLGFAMLVARLEEDLGWDPFSLADDPFYPTRFAEFVAFYEAHQP
jgi:aryl carrier-like protein